MSGSAAPLAMSVDERPVVLPAVTMRTDMADAACTPTVADVDLCRAPGSPIPGIFAARSADVAGTQWSMDMSLDQENAGDPCTGSQDTLAIERLDITTAALADHLFTLDGGAPVVLIVKATWERLTPVPGSRTPVADACHPGCGPRLIRPTKGAALTWECFVPEQTQTIRKVNIRKRGSTPFHMRLPGMPVRVKVRDGMLVAPQSCAPKSCTQHLAPQHAYAQCPTLNPHARTYVLGLAAPISTAPSFEWDRPRLHGPRLRSVLCCPSRVVYHALILAI
ncbi:hypothetical protein WOLCODRAFT_143714 [Wolfiporia cocos MD-104 SS10]|uniref:Uncharacterized protein n=1 Tax=Wolfiporia cocos (strain MD-104) TaxID=742152 RepID=A0A2H3JHP8_WOLCO|nr:hypothetical protein WOLCODRAFT_143714 [Wolfiporia cocos MD-104 SS10]